jgi:hypothetical protein
LFVCLLVCPLVYGVLPPPTHFQPRPAPTTTPGPGGADRAAGAGPPQNGGRHAAAPPAGQPLPRAPLPLPLEVGKGG